jgi:hypothetical protein
MTRQAVRADGGLPDQRFDAAVDGVHAGTTLSARAIWPFSHFACSAGFDQ